MVGRAIPEAIEIALRSLFCENMSHTAAAQKTGLGHTVTECFPLGSAPLEACDGGTP